ncbi:hypothetical protein Bpfe_015814 [Biomphalaria pfeifferi]|uniref:Uncharacterized protein n=1 Tax=Biomphalaria pfeifferi TaxID=112525 RepID=A0AAD8BHH3_BIOPF|nr:hypothetical protein Bpfe_015814 [Biomphalaria pfeifferi]
MSLLRGFVSLQVEPLVDSTVQFNTSVVLNVWKRKQLLTGRLDQDQANGILSEFLFVLLTHART